MFRDWPLSAMIIIRRSLSCRHSWPFTAIINQHEPVYWWVLMTIYNRLCYLQVYTYIVVAHIHLKLFLESIKRKNICVLGETQMLPPPTILSTINLINQSKHVPHVQIIFWSYFVSRPLRLNKWPLPTDGSFDQVAGVNPRCFMSQRPSAASCHCCSWWLHQFMVTVVVPTNSRVVDYGWLL